MTIHPMTYYWLLLGTLLGNLWLLAWITYRIEQVMAAAERLGVLN